MALEIADFNGTVVAPGGDYPFGDIKDAPSGTVVDKAMMDDMIQFFQKLMSNGAITPNNLPDNVTNGYQLIDALRAVIENKVIDTQRSFLRGQGWKLNLYTTAASFTAQTVVISSTYYRFDLGAANVYEFNLATSPTRDIVSFGNAISPGYVAYFFFEPTGGSFTITLNSTNAGIYFPITQSGVVAANTPFTPVTGRTYMVIQRSATWEIIA
jgi:hypothetical protein